MADQFYLGVPAALQVLPAPTAPVPADSVIYQFKGVCAGLTQPSGTCFGTLTGALDAIESAICSLQAGGGGGGGTGGVALNCGTLSPLLTAGNCIGSATGTPVFIAGYTAAGAPLKYFPYTAPTAPFISSCAELLSKIQSCPPTSATATTTYLGFDAAGSPVKAPPPTIAFPTPFIASCSDFTAKLKSAANGGCLPEDAVSAAKVLAIDGLGNPIIRPIVFPAATPIDCVDLRSKLGSCLTLQGTTLSTVIGRDAAGTVGYYPAPSGGGGGSTSSVVPGDTSSIDMSVSQVGTIFTVSGAAIISPAAGNTLQSTAAGLFVPTPAGSVPFIADCVGLNAKLRSTANGGCIGSSAASQTAYLGFDSSGAPVISPLPVAPVQTIACADLLAKLTSCPPVSAVSTATYLGFDATGNPVKAPLPTAPTQFVADCATFLTRHAPTGSGGCVTQDTSAPTFVYAWDPTLAVMRIRPLPASSTPFIASCIDLANKLKSTANGGCIGSVGASQTSYYAIDGSGTPVLAPLPATPTQFIADCAGLLTRLRSTGIGGCLPSSGSAQTNYLGFDASGNATVAPLPAVVVPTAFIANCTDFNSKLTTCVGTSATALTTYLAYDGAGNPVKAPLPGGGVPFIADCIDFNLALTSTISGGCLPEVTTQQPKNIAIDAAGSPVVAPSPIRPATRWLRNAPAAATTLAVTGGGLITNGFADTEATKNPAGATATATTVTIARDGYYDLSAAVLARVQSATAPPAASVITLFSQIVVTRPSAAAVAYRIGQQPIALASLPAVAIANGIDYMFSGTVDSIWLPAGTTVQVQTQSANVANTGAYGYNLIQPIGGGQRLSVTERTANTASV